MRERPWSTQPITGAQHDAWMAEWRRAADVPHMGHPLWNGEYKLRFYDRDGRLISEATRRGPTWIEEPT